MKNGNEFYREAYKLKQQKDGSFKSQIVDTDLEKFDVEIFDGEYIRITQTESGYILFSLDELLEIIDLIKESNNPYFKLKNK
jgi:hypothetical protein